MEINEIKKQNSKLFSALIIFLMLGFIGGIFGSFVYMDYRGVKITPNGVTGISNIKVDEDSVIIDVSKEASKSVVSITGIQERLDFFGNTSQAKSSGTGFIVTSDGIIATNKHVVSDAKATYSVFLNDGKEYKAEIKALDPTTDLAFIKIDAKDLPVLPLGDSNNIEVGQRVIAIGNALGQYQNTVTAGIVSGLSRAISAGDSSGNSIESLENIIQTDAAINPGNSGGPLVNLGGQAVGINTAIDQEGQSIGFAIPINIVKTGLESVLTSGKIKRPALGVRYIPITKEFATRNQLKVNEGAYIYGGRGTTAVLQDSAADKAGIKEGDIITKINDDKIDSAHTLAGLLAKYGVGDKIKITYLRDDKENTVEATLQEFKQ